MKPKSEEGIRKGEAEIRRALGVFLAFFGLVLLVAIFFTPTSLGKILNLASGGLLTFIGGWLIRHAHKSLADHGSSSVLER